MKTAILSAALMLASTVAMAQKSNFQLKVDLKNFNSDSVLVYKGRNVKMDTVLVTLMILRLAVSTAMSIRVMPSVWVLSVSPT